MFSRLLLLYAVHLQPELVQSLLGARQLVVHLLQRNA